jgi:farnesyl diphosphate synthase
VKTDGQLQSFLTDCRSRVEQAMERWLPRPTTAPTTLHQAMRYASLARGKRVRPSLVYAAGRAIGTDPERLDGPACAVEFIHAYSLVHDDLPAMDDDDLRRGQPTCHKAFDEATAILAGDALQTLAFQVLAADDGMQAAPSIRIEMLAILARATGSRGMAGGQALDLASEGTELDLAQLENIHIHKTGALIRASVHLATLSSEALEPETANRLDRYAKCLGLAFQIRDDILDVEGDTAVLGKTPGKDAVQNKATYPALLGLSEAQEKAESLIEEALDNLAQFDEQADPLRWIAQYTAGRRY